MVDCATVDAAVDVCETPAMQTYVGEWVCGFVGLWVCGFVGCGVVGSWVRLGFTTEPQN
jgi:hypothetical protein